MKPYRGSFEPSSADEAADSAIRLHHAQFEQLVDSAERAMREDDFESAAVRSQIAAAYASVNHAGIHASPRLESILGNAAEQVPRSSVALIKRSDRPAVLHVVTEGYETGGHTRLIARWAAADQTRAHHLVTTRQGPRLPPFLGEAIRASGGAVFDLTLTGRNVLERAAVLRSLGSSADYVALHIHPFDVLPNLAFSRALHPPVAIVNHADHLFWIGGQIADRVINLREAGAHLTSERRGIESAAQSLLSIPVVPPRAVSGDSPLRAQLGIPHDNVVCVTVAADWKYRGNGDLSYLDVAATIAKRYERLWFLAVGAENDVKWRAVSDETGGRVRAIARTPHVAQYLRAADVYVDSVPTASLTSLLEAGSRGLPLVSLRLHPDGAEVLCANGPGLDGSLLRARTPAEFENILKTLFDPSERHAAGKKAHERIAEENAPEMWVRALADIAPRTRDGRTGDVGIRHNQLDRVLATLPGVTSGLAPAYRSHVRLARPGLRLRLWVEAARAGYVMPAHPLLSDGTIRWLRGLGSPVRRWRDKGVTR